MSEYTDQTTIFYTLKLKRARTPIEAFEKMRKAIKKKGASNDWSYSISEDNQTMTVNFGDNKSENFVVSFDSTKVCDSFCKVFFPLSGEEFDDEKKSEFKALLNMIYAARTSFSVMKITDDYGISESYLDTKVNKITLRELTDDELERAKRLYADGHTSIRSFITALMYDLRDLPYDDDFIPHINMNIGCFPWHFWRDGFDIGDYYRSFIDSFVFETLEYKNQGRIYNLPDYFSDLNGVWFAVNAFIIGITELTGNFHYKSGWDPKSTQVLRLYSNKCLPLINSADDFGKCTVAYRFFVSSMEYLGFKYAGRTNRYLYPVPKTIVGVIKSVLNGKKVSILEDALFEWSHNKEKYL